MDSHRKESKASSRIDDRLTSDVVVRLRTQDRDHWVYCHSHILVQQSKYFADRLSDTWPMCQILDSRNCVEVQCEESDFDHTLHVLRLLYLISDSSVNADICHGVRTALGILQAAFKLGCPEVVTACAEYLEAVPWEEAEEEDILKVIPNMGSQVGPVLARLQPVTRSAIIKLFVSAMRFATSSPPESLNDLKRTAQEQLEYMLTEDDDASLLTADSNEVKLEVVQCIKRLHDRFSELVESLQCDSEDGKTLLLSFKSGLSDLCWACQILSKMEIMRDFVHRWTEMSVKILKVVRKLSGETETVLIRIKVLEVAAKVLEAIGYGTVVMPATERLHMTKVWLSFVRETSPLIGTMSSNDGIPTIDDEIWQSLESSFVSLILTLPSAAQAEILTEWWTDPRYPDLTEAFEAWCYRSKIARRRREMLSGDDHST
ncbi:unnamed protein product [Cuscuta epithymum]|uniref:BTB domain-containing protein n=1 Tax=Cuscuta epithymum TaxID=186058 RepID=A0AAV0DDH1_9ASTE|nr:unnamed protein product [Cuscuta epithymum]